MKKVFLGVSILSIALPIIAEAASGECHNNFTVNGEVNTGQVFKTSASILNISRSNAVKTAARDLANVGFQITVADDDAGIISASQVVSYGQGKTAPLNITVDQVNGGVKMSLIYSTSAGVYSPADAVMKQFCSTVDAVERVAL